MGAFKLVFYYGAYLYFLAAPLLVFLIARRKGGVRWGAACLLAPLSVLAYARFVEPRILLTMEHDIALERCFESSGAVRVALFSDTHIGIFGNTVPVRRIVRRLRALDPDFAMIAGDFTYHIEPERIEKAFSALGTLPAPVYAVLGNHDIGLPGPDMRAHLIPPLEKIGVRLIDDERAVFSGENGDIEIVGLSDLWGERQNRALLDSESGAPRLVLTHNPATARTLGPAARYDLMLAGHTHGGQIYIPYVTCRVEPGACIVTLYGLAQTRSGPVFVTSGTGMVGLAMRFLVPPRIDMLNISYSACGAA